MNQQLLHISQHLHLVFISLPTLHTPNFAPDSYFPTLEMANYVHMRPVALLATILLCLPTSSVCGRVVGKTGTTAVTTTTSQETGYSTIASPMADYCATDFSTVSYADVTAACPATSPGASTACCAAFRVKACQYEAQVNDFGGLCPMLFINYLGAAGPYPAGYFVGPCVDGSKGFCVRA